MVPKAGEGLCMGLWTRTGAAAQDSQGARVGRRC